MWVGAAHLIYSTGGLSGLQLHGKTHVGYTATMKKEFIQAAYMAARDVRERAYAPYSTYKVGAAIQAAGIDTLFTGCNVENISYGATICAERTAIVKMISTIGHHPLELVVVVSDDSPAARPCGMCLQVLAEFCHAGTTVALATLEGIERVLRFEQLLPEPFAPEK